MPGSKIFTLILIGYALFSGVYLLLISFGIVKRKFKDSDKQISFERKLKENSSLYKFGAIAFLALFIWILIQSGIFTRLFN